MDETVSQESSRKMEEKSGDRPCDCTGHNSGEIPRRRETKPVPRSTVYFVGTVAEVGVSTPVDRQSLKPMTTMEVVTDFALAYKVLEDEELNLAVRQINLDNNGRQAD